MKKVNPDLSDADTLQEPHPPRVSSSRFRPSLIWLVPAVAALVGLSLLAQAWFSAGPQIAITFQKATGLEAGKTVVKYKDVVIGNVSAIALSPDNATVEVTVDLKKSAENFAREGSRFWTVRPRIGAGGISGIDTMFSGAYIGADMAESGEPAKKFVGLEAPPSVVSGSPGRRFILHAEDLGSLEIGAPVYFRRIQVGQVVAYHLDPDGNGVTIEVFVHAPNDRFVTVDTRFWNASGVDLSLGADGLRLNAQSLATMVSGGIAFTTPRSDDAPAPEQAQFLLARNQQAAMAEPDGVPMRVRMRFDQSLRGLTMDAPVEFVGINIGKVTSIFVDYDAARQRFPVIVDAVIYPRRLRHVLEKLTATAGTRPEEPAQVMRALIERGMRAQPKPGNLLTGQLYIAFDFVPNAPRAVFDANARPFVVPTLRTDISRLQEQVASIVDKLDQVPFDSIGRHLDESLVDLTKTLKQVNGDILPETRSTLQETQRSLGLVNEALAPDAPLPQNLNQTLLELQRSARSLRTLTDLLGRHPEALIRGRADDSTSVPSVRTLEKTAP